MRAKCIGFSGRPFGVVQLESERKRERERKKERVHYQHVSDYWRRW